ncbi:hypothetical protein ACTU44_11940 [Thalassospira sp. SM2505]
MSRWRVGSGGLFTIRGEDHHRPLNQAGDDHGNQGKQHHMATSRVYALHPTCATAQRSVYPPESPDPAFKPGTGFWLLVIPPILGGSVCAGRYSGSLRIASLSARRFPS